MKKVEGVTAIEAFTPQAKRAVVVFDHRKASIHQLADAVAKCAPLHGKAYEAAVLVKVDPLNTETTAKVVAACKTVKGVTRCEAVDAATGTVGIYLEKLTVAADAKPPHGVRQGAVIRALRAAGLTAILLVPEKPKQ